MINLTPHPITLQLPDGSRVTFAPSGTVARVSTTELDAGTVAGVPVIRRALGKAAGLPTALRHDPVIVSSMVLATLPAGTRGVYAPDTGPTAIRDAAGQVVAVTRLVTP
jgi:hypothetical protein